MIIETALSYQKLDFEHVQTLVSWAEQEGWNPGLDDAEIFYKTDPDGFYGAFIDNQLIGGGSLVSYNGAFGFMGFFIVKPEYRSQGLGKQLWQFRRDTLLARLKPGATIGMDGVVNMQDFYHRGGFELAFRDERYVRLGETFPAHACITTLAHEDWRTLLAYDQECFGFARESFLQQWLQQPHGKTLIYQDQAQIQGYAVLRPCVSGWKIGPLFADTPAIARSLYQSCLGLAINQPVYLDIPTVNLEAVALVHALEAHYVFECGRMYWGEAPKLPLAKIFGITSFELG